MRSRLPLVVLLLAGCTATDQPSLEANRELPTIVTRSCERPARRNCTFINTPVRLEAKAHHFPESPFPYFRTRNELKFVDAYARHWVAPAGTWTDGASIPAIFVPLIGNPRSRRFMNAATVHDAYCAARNSDGPYYHTATWQEVHRMFYDGLRVGGTDPVTAGIMYAAVYLGGPRWKEVRTPPRRQALNGAGAPATRTGALTIAPAAAGTAPALRALQSDTPLTAGVSEQRLIDAFREVKAYIESAAPSIDELERHLTRVEMDLTGATGRPTPKRNNFRSGTPGDDGLDGGDGGGGDGGHGGDNGGDDGGDNPY